MGSFFHRDLPNFVSEGSKDYRKDCLQNETELPGNSAIAKQRFSVQTLGILVTLFKEARFSV